MKKLILFPLLFIVGCATITNDSMVPISLCFSYGSIVQCQLNNKRGSWTANLPGVVSVRRSDDVLQFRCKTDDNRDAFGSIPSEMGGKIVASAVFLDFGMIEVGTNVDPAGRRNWVFIYEE